MLQYAVLAAAPLYGGTEPDLLGEVTWWQTDVNTNEIIVAQLALARSVGATSTCHCG